MRKGFGIRTKRSFTLIEVLASMAVLVLIMLALLRVFSEATSASTKATVTVVRNAAARTAMQMIRDDLRSSLLDGQIAMYKEADTTDKNYDRIGFVTLSANNDATNRSYSLIQVQYYVLPDVRTNLGTPYTTWVLKRFSRKISEARQLGADMYTSAGKRWWKETGSFGSGFVICDNIVRFDVWVCNEKGDNLSGIGSSSFGGGQVFDSTAYTMNPPSYVDIYLQVTSDEAMMRGQLALKSGETDAGNGILYRESDILLTRVTPVMWAAEKAHPYIFQK